MRVGTKSVLVGAHCFFIHPFMVAWGWWRLYEFPRDPRLWAAFLVHDWGLWGKPNMDGPEGESHPFFGAAIMGGLFDPPSPPCRKDHNTGTFVVRINPVQRLMDWLFGDCEEVTGSLTWYTFTFYHSRYMAARYGIRPSRLCFADKMAIVVEPSWLYLPRVTLTGEIQEYQDASTHWSQNERATQEERGMTTTGGRRDWHRAVKSYVARWIEEHKDGRDDEWTAVRPHS